MPASKHRKKGQKKAVKRPGRARVVREPPDVVQERLLVSIALEKLEAEALGDEDYDLLMLAMETVVDEVTALNVDGTHLVPCIGSRAAIVDAFIDGFEPAFGKVPGFEANDAKRTCIEGWLARLGEVGFLRFEGDETELAVAIPAAG